MMTFKYKQQSKANPWTTQVWKMSVYTWIFPTSIHSETPSVVGWIRGCRTMDMEGRLQHWSILRFWCPQWVLEPIPCGCWGRIVASMVKPSLNFPYFSWFYIFGGFVMFLNEGITLFHGGQNQSTLEMMMEVEIRARLPWVPRWALGLSQ